MIDSKWLGEAEERIRNEPWLSLSGAIALKILVHLRAEGISVVDLSDMTIYSVDVLSEILRGRKNLDLQTITNLQTALGIKLIEVPYVELRTKYQQP